jgi:Protein of unknown function (DUF1579)
MKTIFATLFCVLLFSASQSIAQEPIKPGKEHAFLKEAVGEWDVTFDGNMKGTSSYKMVHNDLWLESKVAMDMPQGKFTGQGLDSYDPVKKKYVAIWVDSMSASPIVMEGDMDAATKTLTLTGKGPDPTGKLVEYKMSTEYKDKDNHIFKMWMGDLKGDPMMTAVYKRKK